MTRTILSIFVSSWLVIQSCDDATVKEAPKEFDWGNRETTISDSDSLQQGQTYLSVYSEIYSETLQRKNSLTVTVSLRNTAMDTIRIVAADYFNTKGERVKSYVEDAVDLYPMETVEIVIPESDLNGGTGGNFIFNWSKPVDATEPLFEAVMISTSGQQGLSFLTKGERIR